jgi:fumarate reductase flavoprotein subunit
MIELRPACEAVATRHADVVIVGGGACGLTAAMSARDVGADVLVLERDAIPRGNTAWSIAMIPAAGSRLQRAAGIDDDAHRFASDIVAKTKGRTDAAMAMRIAEQSGPTIDWLTERHGLKLRLLTELVYPGHSRHRYHVTPTIAGDELQTMLLAGAQAAGVPVATGHAVTKLFANGDRVTAVGGDDWTIGCDALILATDGFGAARDLVAEYIPDMAEATYCGHAATCGDGLAAGQKLGAATADLAAYQGHSVGARSGLPQTWALIIDGGIQVNREGRRFANEMRGYSEQAADIVRQPGGVAWTIFDAEAEVNAALLPHHRTMRESGEIVVCADIASLSALTGAPEAALAETLSHVSPACSDPFGRTFARGLTPPYRAVEVRGALFHTQGGLVVDRDARVLRGPGDPLPNLFAGGGVARGLSGPGADGYLGGNGLLCAIVLGRLAGQAAAAQTGGRR